uniref:Uncharacterized protein n=1 Tax=Wuchereria bancrofti TaxID=6293 RepID=A0AAF5RUS4_WUCBA
MPVNVMRWASLQRCSSLFQKLPPLATINVAGDSAVEAVNTCSAHWSGMKHLTSSQQVR